MENLFVLYWEVKTSTDRWKTENVAKIFLIAEFTKWSWTIFRIAKAWDSAHLNGPSTKQPVIFKIRREYYVSPNVVTKNSSLRGNRNFWSTKYLSVSFEIIILHKDYISRIGQAKAWTTSKWISCCCEDRMRCQTLQLEFGQITNEVHLHH